MAISSLKKTASKINMQKDTDNFFDIIDEAAQKNSLLIFLTDTTGNVLYSTDEYSALYNDSSYNNEENHSSQNPYLSSEDSLNWEKGVIRNLPYSHMELIRKLLLSGENSLGYITENSNTYVYGVNLESCALLSNDNIIMCISMPLGSVTGTTTILRIQLLWVSVLSLSLAFILAYFLSRKFEKPLRSITQQAKNIAKGEFHVADHKGFCRELDDLSDTLNETAASLERLEHSRQELLANISHDLRTPLTMIKGYAEMVQEISWNDEEKRNQDLNIIIREADRLTSLVGEILEYSSIQSVNQKPIMTAFNLSDTVKNVIHQFDALCSEQGFLIEQNIDLNIWINGNRTQIERVIYNFIDNAVNHTDSRQKISVTLSCRGETVHFEVKDYGQGIPAEDIPYIWDRYYTSRNRKNKATVSGLGLSIAKELLTLHEAQFGAECHDGCVFWFELTKI
ncbi:MAG: ATP-binding protein [Lachnospiraceae bacterium]